MSNHFALMFALVTAVSGCDSARETCDDLPKSVASGEFAYTVEGPGVCALVEGNLAVFDTTAATFYSLPDSAFVLLMRARGEDAAAVAFTRLGSSRPSPGPQPIADLLSRTPPRPSPRPFVEYPDAVGFGGFYGRDGYFNSTGGTLEVVETEPQRFEARFDATARTVTGEVLRFRGLVNARYSTQAYQPVQG